MNTYFPLEEKNIKIHGRTVERSPLALFWTGSGIELVTDASELHFELESGFDIYEQWIRIEVNGYSSVRMPLGKGVSDICVFRGMEKRSMKHVRLFKEVQPMGISKYTSEGYYDPTTYEALSNIEKEEKAARRVYRPLVYICYTYAVDI